MYRRNRATGFGPEVKRRIMLGTYALSAGYYDRFYDKAQRARTLLRHDFTKVFDSGIDLLLTPVTPSVSLPSTSSMTEFHLTSIFSLFRARSAIILLARSSSRRCTMYTVEANFVRTRAVGCTVGGEDGFAKRDHPVRAAIGE